ncbi:hypothetical protein LJC61_03335 [Ruminococcaceae bacterium OttesenSCG-928-A16]|nr:hypothetical protein [Ruminococcaceae bacterium OttesenSCG-928-A16]
MGEFNLEAYQLVIQLQQLTPMIHFQHNEYGVTPRASEVKPKLDRFIIAQFGGIEKLRKEHGNWIDREHGSLKYKMTFVRENSSQSVDIPYMLFYANMGEERKRNPIKMLVGDCKMTILCAVPSLKDYIEESISTFFVTHTFGMMQGKGFGGYLPQNYQPSEKDICAAIKKVYQCKSVYSLDTLPPIIVSKGQNHLGKWITPRNVFDDIIKPFHSIMKSGVNFGVYERSFLFQHFHKNPNIQYGNDKAFVKAKGIAPVVYKIRNLANGEHKRKYENFKYVRALLGVTGKVEYIQGLDANDKPLKNSKGKVIKEIITIKGMSGIERFASPVRYRIIGHKLYIFATPIEDEIHGAPFQFQSSIGTESISVPDAHDFDIDTFLSDFITHINNDPVARRAARFSNEKFLEVK